MGESVSSSVRFGTFCFLFFLFHRKTLSTLDALVTLEFVVCVWWIPRHGINLHRIIFHLGLFRFFSFFFLLSGSLQILKITINHVKKGKFGSVAAAVATCAADVVAHRTHQNQDEITRWQFGTMQTIHFFLFFFRFVSIEIRLFPCRRVGFSQRLVGAFKQIEN